MEDYKEIHNQIIGEKIVSALEANNMKGYYLKSAKEVVPLLKSMLVEGEIISFGGSQTLEECGVIAAIRNGNYKMIDRFAKNLSSEQRGDLFRQAFTSDTLLTSVNAITFDGRLYCVDGTGNRIAAMIYGPKQVIVVVGVNKIVESIEAAVNRVRLISAPVNCIRFDSDTYCQNNGYCMYLNQEIGKNTGCRNTMCCFSTIFSRQQVKNRIHVIIVGETLGF